MPDTLKDPGRRAFLDRFRSGTDVQSRPELSAIRPPWAVQFDANCTGCADCVPACPEGIIALDGANLPAIDFNKGECSFCEACADACSENVFDRSVEPAWHLDITVAKNCFAEQGIYCRSCGDICPERAIRIPPQLGGRARVIIDSDTCTRCGACQGACPADAILITPHKEYAHE
ncbi:MULTISPECIES: ferredoxin-type protein NapF [Thalassospira]|uniref:Ferredoxin-type protein NapF n=1 Tax=Thalassospira aquimaris TaxID=3037796 RepID=A0ABT6G6U8_9PROT|nr:MULTISPECIES: ferredoxin-type protein NapF [Thalassospira]MDG4717766.1 ferredoxin-type protein NapF [Thalassospira sp. FZY0004]